mgnify:CR=1 FL=1
MKSFRSLAVSFLVAAALTLAAQASAKPVTFEIDAVHSRVQFTIRHLVSKVTGNFAKFQGQIVYDAEGPAASSVNAEIDAASINTMNDRRDGHLRSPDFFDTAKFPTLAFTSATVTPGTAGRFKVEGNFSMHGVTKPLTLDTEFLGTGPGPDGTPRIGFEAKASIDRKDYGIVWNKTLDQGGTILGDDVRILIQIEGIAASPAASPAETPAEKEAPKGAK